ncbi:MAG: twin-arginine translocase TatA/TatE family subunit [Croceibacterium sp.]
MQIIVIALIILVLFGRGRISEMMGDFGKGISSFKKGIAEADARPDEKPMKQIASPPPVEPMAEGPAAPARTPEEQAAATRDPG